MKKSEAPRDYAQSQPAARQAGGASFGSPQNAPAAGLAALISNSPRQLAQKQAFDAIHHSPAQVSQRKKFERLFGGPAQGGLRPAMQMKEVGDMPNRPVAIAQRTVEIAQRCKSCDDETCENGEKCGANEKKRKREEQTTDEEVRNCGEDSRRRFYRDKRLREKFRSGNREGTRNHDKLQEELKESPNKRKKLHDTTPPKKDEEGRKIYQGGRPSWSDEVTEHFFGDGKETETKGKVKYYPVSDVKSLPQEKGCERRGALLDRSYKAVVGNRLGINGIRNGGERSQMDIHPVRRCVSGIQ